MRKNLKQSEGAYRRYKRELKRDDASYRLSTPGRGILKYEKPAFKAKSANMRFHASLEFLFHRLNDDLFGPYLCDGKGRRRGRAPDCILCAEYTSSGYGGFAANAVWSEKFGRQLDQITIVFDRFDVSDVKGLISVLAHEMVHAVQFRDGTAGRNNYHNANFRDLMRSIGLQASQTGRH